MPTDRDLRQKVAAERRELAGAVASLRAELDHTADRGKKVGAGIGAATSAALAVRLLLRLRRRRG